MSISKTGCSKSITKEDLEYKYKKGFRWCKSSMQSYIGNFKRPAI